jgi:hypothetical protein
MAIIFWTRKHKSLQIIIVPEHLSVLYPLSGDSEPNFLQNNMNVLNFTALGTCISEF